MSGPVSTHFEAGPSTLPRVVVCPASVKASRPFPNDSSFAAERGTRLHSFAELCIKTAKLPRDFPTDGEWAVYTEEDREAVTAAVEYVRDVLIEYPGEVFCELDLDLSKFYPGMRGSADCVIVSGRTIIVIDFKFGRNKVEASTPQLKAYALGALEWFVFYDFDTVVVAIVQPFGDHYDRAEYTPAELYEWAGTVMVPALKNAFSDAPTYNPTEAACKYCRARGVCKARIAAHYETVAAALDNVPAPASEHLTAEELGAILAKADKFEAVLGDMKAHAMKTLATGGTIPGLKLVEGRSLRKWSNPAETVPKLIEAIQQKRPDLAALDAAELVTKVEPIGISAAEKLIGKTNPLFASLTVKPQGKATLAPESDSRPAFIPNADVLDALDAIEI